MTQEDAMKRLALLGNLIDSSPEADIGFEEEDVKQFQQILEAHNYTVRRLMREVSHNSIRY